jgi:hypothetical protein
MHNTETHRESENVTQGHPSCYLLEVEETRQMDTQHNLWNKV